MRLNGNFLVSVDVNFTQNIVMVHKEKKHGEIIDIFLSIPSPPCSGHILVVSLQYCSDVYIRIQNLTNLFLPTVHLKQTLDGSLAPSHNGR